MLYLLDANILIDAHRDYYPLDRVPEFWAWLVDCAARQQVKISLENEKEVLAGTPDDLIRWMNTNRSVLLLDEKVDPTLVRQVISEGYAPDLTGDERRKAGRDPFLIAYALKEPRLRTVVTTEASASSRQRANRKIPDVCAVFSIRCCNTFELIRELDFRTLGGRRLRTSSAPGPG